MILLIDNYDSFVANIARYFRRLNLETRVVRNDELDLQAITELNPAAIVISPGPCTPSESAISLDVVREFTGIRPILGICLGHQVIAQVFGTTVTKANEPFHGRQSTLTHNGHFLFKSVPVKFDACRYHSLAVDESTLPSDFQVTCRSTDGTVMAIANDTRQLWGVQFHPESILTPFGFQILQNFAKHCGLTSADHEASSFSLFQSESFPRGLRIDAGTPTGTVQPRRNPKSLGSSP